MCPKKRLNAPEVGNTYVCTYVCMYVRMYVCMYVGQQTFVNSVQCL